jgi:3-oxoacyl-[acyl-carrier protein] reductase
MLHELPVERLRATLDANLLGAAWTARAFMAALARTGPRPEGGAALIFTGSTAGRFGERDHCDYSMSKAGLYGLVCSLKNEIVRLDPYARVNMVEPGWTVTHMARPALQDPAVVRRVVRTMPLRQIARAADIARTIVFLGSPLLARHISGEVITVAGGMEGRLLWREQDVDVPAIHRRLDEE